MPQQSLAIKEKKQRRLSRYLSDVNSKLPKDKNGLVLQINNIDEDDELSESDIEDFSDAKDSKVEKHSTPGNQ